MLVRLLVVAALLGVVLVLTRLRAASRQGQVGAHALPPLPRDIARTNATWVVFTTEYCATCGPVKERIAQIDPTADLVEIDVAQRPDLARRYHVRTAPTVFFAAANGRIHARFVGNVPEAELASVRR